MNDNSGTGFALAFVGIILMLALGMNFWIAYGTERTETFTVVKTERVATEKSSKYLVFTDKGVYKNTDSILRLKFNSSDVYGSILPTQKYQCQVVGFRNGFFSWYPNILSCEHKD